MASTGKRAFRLQPRDLEIMAMTGEYGVVDTTLVRDRFFPDTTTPRACQIRLQALVQQRYLDLREYAEPSEFHKTKSRRPPTKKPTVYRLTRSGAELVEQQSGVRPPRAGRGDWPSSTTVLHRLGVVRTRMIVDVAFVHAGLPAPEWIHEQDTRPGALTTLPMDDRFILYESFRRPGGRITSRPDAEAKIHLPAMQEDLIASIEYDRSNMELPDMVAKLDGYEALWKTEAYRKRWPILTDHEVRAFFVCQTQERIESLRNAFVHHAAADRVRFTTVAELTVANALYSPIWQDVGDTRRRLLRPPEPLDS